MLTTVYYAPDAVGSLSSVFTDGTYVYERVHQVGSLGALDGWLKKIGKKIKKVGKRALKTVKKVAKVSMKVVKKALPIVNTALTFIPGVGWAAKAALTVAEMGIKAIDKAKAKKKAKRMAKVKKMTQTFNQAAAAKQQNTASISKSKNIQTASATPTQTAQPQYSTMDFVKINAAVNRSKASVDDVLNIVKKQASTMY